MNVNARYTRDPLKLLLTKARARAKHYGQPFELDHAWVEEQLAKYDWKCSVTGMPLSFDKTEDSWSRPWAPSIDRVDSLLGYTRTNSRIVCWAYNIAKAQWSDEIVLAWAKALVYR